MSALWQSWLHGDLPWLVLTLGAYLLAVWLYKRSNFYPLLVPVFTAVALVVAVLLATIHRMRSTAQGCSGSRF